MTWTLVFCRNRALTTLLPYKRALPIVRGLVAALLLWSSGIFTLHAQPRPLPPPTGWQFTPLTETVHSTPRWFLGTDAKAHLVYELLLTNALTVPVTVTAVEVRNADSGAALVKLTGPSLLAAMSLPTSPDAPAVVLPPATVGVVWLDVPLADKAQVPAFVTHRLTIAAVDGVPTDFLSFTGVQRAAVDQRPPVVLGPPLAGQGWYALGSCCDGPHRRTLIAIGGQSYLPQRFAIDFNQLDAQNRPGVGNPKLPASFPTFGQPVIAVADATVVVAVGRYRDLLVDEPREDLTHESEGGNRVVLDLGNGRFAAYAHLQQGSVLVKPGDRVERGQPIAKVGSSGTGGGPHLHFQVMDRPSILLANGLPYVFDTFKIIGQTPPLLQALPYYDTFLHIPITTSNAGPRRKAFPLGGDLLGFPPLPGQQSPSKPGSRCHVSHC